jgi:outer membrane protein, heavy metal efflux system
VLQRVLNQHTDVLTGLNALKKNRYLLEAAQVQPIPDFDVHVLIQKDYTTPQRTLVYSGALTLPIPLWDQNRGNILQAQNQLHQAAHSVNQTKLQLTSTLADAYNRYRTAHEQVQIVVGQVEDSVRAFVGVYKRHREVEGISTFADVVTAEQNLVTYISTYISALGLQWTAVVDIANLLQTDDLFGLGQNEQAFPVPDLEQLLPEACPTPRRPLSHQGRTLAEAIGVPGTTEPLRLSLEPARTEFAPAFIPAEGNAPGPRPSLSFADQLPAAVAAPLHR